jgi:hypothetical protein
MLEIASYFGENQLYLSSISAFKLRQKLVCLLILQDQYLLPLPRDKNFSVLTNAVRKYVVIESVPFIDVTHRLQAPLYRLRCSVSVQRRQRQRPMMQHEGHMLMVV